jgi:hypothetical protein
LKAQPFEFWHDCLSKDKLLVEFKHGIYADEVKELINSEAVIQEAEKYGTGAAIFWQKNGSKYV